MEAEKSWKKELLNLNACSQHKKNEERYGWDRLTVSAVLRGRESRRRIVLHAISTKKGGRQSAVFRCIDNELI